MSSNHIPTITPATTTAAPATRPRFPADDEAPFENPAIGELGLPVALGAVPFFAPPGPEPAPPVVPALPVPVDPLP